MVCCLSAKQMFQAYPQEITSNSEHHCLTNVKPFNPGPCSSSPSKPFHLQSLSLRKAQLLKAVQLLLTFDTMVSRGDFDGRKLI